MSGTLIWLSEVTGRDETVQVEELRDGFLLLQVLSVIEPASVDWDGYNAACEQSVDPIHVNYDLLEQGARHRSDPKFRPSMVADARGGDFKCLMDLASALEMLYEKKFGKANSSMTKRSNEPEARKPVYNDGETRAPASKNISKITALKDSDEEDEKEGMDYDAGEAHFKPMVRWIFQLIRRYIKEVTLEDEYDLLLFLLEDPNPCVVNGRAIAPLCSGRVYQHASHVCFRRGEGADSNDHLTSKKWTFLDDLLTTNCLSVTLIGPVRDMIADRDPFYESLHISIMEAFMRAAGSFIYPETVAESPRNSNHPRHDSGVEDRLLTWLNMAVAEMATEPPIEQIIDLVDALSDLDLLLRVLTVVLDGGTKNQPTRRSKSANKSSTLKGFDAIKQISKDFGICFPFVQAELCKSRSTATFKPLVIDFFSRVRHVVQNRLCNRTPKVVRPQIRSGSASLKKNRKNGEKGSKICSGERGSKSCPNLPLIACAGTGRNFQENTSTAQSTNSEFHLPEIEPGKISDNAFSVPMPPVVCNLAKTEALPANTKIRRISRRRLKEIHPLANPNVMDNTDAPKNIVIEQTHIPKGQLNLEQKPGTPQCFPTEQTEPTKIAVEGGTETEATSGREEFEKEEPLKPQNPLPFESGQLEQELERGDLIINRGQNEQNELEFCQDPINIHSSNDVASETTISGEKMTLILEEENECLNQANQDVAQTEYDGISVSGAAEVRPPSGAHQYLLQDDLEEEENREHIQQPFSESVTGRDVIHVNEQFKHLFSDSEEDEDETRESCDVEGEGDVGLPDKFEVTEKLAEDITDRQLSLSPKFLTADLGNSVVVVDDDKEIALTNSTWTTVNVTANQEDAPIHAEYGSQPQPASEEDSEPLKNYDHSEECNTRQYDEILTENIAINNAIESFTDSGENVLISPQLNTESNDELPNDSMRQQQMQSLQIESRTQSPQERGQPDTETQQTESSHVLNKRIDLLPSEPPSRNTEPTEASDFDANEGSVYFDVNSGKFYDRKSPKKGNQQQQKRITIDHIKYSDSTLVTDGAVEDLGVMSAYETQRPVSKLNLSEGTATAIEPARRKSEAFTILFQPSEKKKLRRLSHKGQSMREDGRETITDAQPHQPVRKESEAFTIVLEPELTKGSRRTLIQRTTDGKDKKFQEEKLSEHQRAEEAKLRKEENRRRIEEKARIRQARRMEDQTNASDKFNVGKSIPLNAVVENATRSNRQLVRNALVHVCLAGTVNAQIKEDVLEDLDSSPGRNFVILFRGTKDHAFRALYAYDPKLEQVLKLYGTGPMTLKEADVSEYFKYDSGSRSFKTVPTKTFGISVHAVSVAGPTGGSRSAKRGKSKA